MIAIDGIAAEAVKNNMRRTPSKTTVKNNRGVPALGAAGGDGHCGRLGGLSPRGGLREVWNQPVKRGD